MTRRAKASRCVLVSMDHAAYAENAYSSSAPGKPEKRAQYIRNREREGGKGEGEQKHNNKTTTSIAHTHTHTYTHNWLDARLRKSL